MKVMQSITSFLKSTGQFIYCFRKVFLAIPVLVLAFLLAKENLAQLPEQVGLMLSREGTYSILVSRTKAVWWPFTLTVVSLGLMGLSRKAFYPWLVSVVTLALPLVIRVLNMLF